MKRPCASSAGGNLPELGPSSVETEDYHQEVSKMPRAPTHPGEILADELQEIGATPTELSRQINVPANRNAQIIHGRRGVTGDTALRQWATRKGS